MKCKICKNVTDWDSSCGDPKCIVCNTCFDRLVKATGRKPSRGRVEVYRIIFEVADIKEENGCR